MIVQETRLASSKSDASSGDDAAGLARVRSLQIGMNWFEERPGGLERMFDSILRGLPEADVSVRGLVAATPAVDRRTNGVVRSFAAPDDPLLTRLRGVRRSAEHLARDYRPDLVAMHFALYGAPVLNRFKDVPKVFHFHGPWSDESGAGTTRRQTSVMIKRAYEGRVYRRVHMSIVLSEAFATALESFGVAREKIRVVPGCVDTERFAPHEDRARLRTEMGLPLDRPVIFCIRRLVARMGLEDLIDAMVQIKQRVPDVLLVVGGRGPLADQLQARVEARGLRDNVRMAGFIADEELARWYASADLSVVPTRALEGFGLTTIESLACGTPVLVTPVGGLPEAVAGLDGLVLDDVGPEAIAAGIIGALTGSHPMPDRQACTAYARTRFSISAVCTRIGEVYREVLRQG
jgi:glycosyltransferase involved in cell wall biosynthesis